MLPLLLLLPLILANTPTPDPWLTAFGHLPDPPFAGIPTFAHLPHVRCLDHPEAGFDVAIVGVPFDGAVSYRPGARFGPFAIRSGSRRQSKARGYTSVFETNPYSDGLQILDCGDLPLTPYSPPLALLQITTAYRSLLSRPLSTSSGIEQSRRGFQKGLDGEYHPRLVSLGGDHTIVLPIMQALWEVYGEMSVLHFDAHIDTWNPARYPGSGSNSDPNADINHGTFFWAAYERGYIKPNSSIHAGIRTRYSGPEDLGDDVTAGFQLIHTYEMDEIGVEGISRKIKARVGGNPVIVSLDIDVLDPSFAPATGTPESGGWSSRELRRLIHSLRGLNIVAFDLVEVSPSYDTQAELTGIVAADLVFDFLGLLTLGVEGSEREMEGREGGAGVGMGGGGRDEL